MQGLSDVWIVFSEPHKVSCGHSVKSTMGTELDATGLTEVWFMEFLKNFNNPDYLLVKFPTSTTKMIAHFQETQRKIWSSLAFESQGKWPTSN